MTALYLITFSGLSLAQPEPEQITLLDKKQLKESKKSSSKRSHQNSTAGIYFEGGGLQTSDPISGDLIGYQLDRQISELLVIWMQMYLFWPVGIWVGFAVTQILIMTIVTMTIQDYYYRNQMLLV